ncbi:MAG: pyruvate kinase, partial [Myxococcales bacterium]|nr:pyruvate kinase [Myxococcales bacterium]
QTLALYWGVIPILFSPASEDGETLFIDMDHAIVAKGLFDITERVVITAAQPIKKRGSVNVLRLHEVGEMLS